MDSKEALTLVSQVLAEVKELCDGVAASDDPVVLIEAMEQITQDLGDALNVSRQVRHLVQSQVDQTEWRNTKGVPTDFLEFPPEAICPVCQTNDAGPCLILPIQFGGQDGDPESATVHVACALPHHLNIQVGVLFRTVKG